MRCNVSDSKFVHEIISEINLTMKKTQRKIAGFLRLAQTAAKLCQDPAVKLNADMKTGLIRLELEWYPIVDVLHHTGTGIACYQVTNPHGRGGWEIGVVKSWRVSESREETKNEDNMDIVGGRYPASAGMGVCWSVEPELRTRRMRLFPTLPACSIIKWL